MMTSELKAALERMKSNSYAETDEDMMQYGDDARLLADAYVKLMASRESSRERGEFHAPTREWFEWLKNRLIDLAHSEIKDNIKAATAFTHAAEICVTWRDRFESCGAFDRDGMERQ